MWGVNPRKSLKGRKNSKEPKSKGIVASNGSGLRLKRGPICKSEKEDPILALL